MACIELIERHVLRMPHVVSHHLQIVGALTNGVLVEAVKACLVDDVDDSLLGLADGERGVAGSHLSVGLHAEHGAEVRALLRIACSVSGHNQLPQRALYLVWYLGCQGYLAVNVTAQPDGNQLIRI